MGFNSLLLIVNFILSECQRRDGQAVSGREQEQGGQRGIVHHRGQEHWMTT